MSGSGTLRLCIGLNKKDILSSQYYAPVYIQLSPSRQVLL